MSDTLVDRITNVNRGVSELAAYKNRLRDVTDGVSDVVLTTLNGFLESPIGDDYCEGEIKDMCEEVGTDLGVWEANTRKLLQKMNDLCCTAQNTANTVQECFDFYNEPVEV